MADRKLLICDLPLNRLHHHAISHSCSFVFNLITLIGRYEWYAEIREGVVLHETNFIHESKQQGSTTINENNTHMMKLKMAKSWKMFLSLILKGDVPKGSKTGPRKGDVPKGSRTDPRTQYTFEFWPLHGNIPGGRGLNPFDPLAGFAYF